MGGFALALDIDSGEVDEDWVEGEDGSTVE